MAGSQPGSSHGIDLRLVWKLNYAWVDRYLAFPSSVVLRIRRRRGKPDALLHHSDRGSQYTSEQFQKLMSDHAITVSCAR